MPTRRDFLKFMGVGGAAAWLSACGRPLPALFGHVTPPGLSASAWHDTPEERTAARVLNRLTYGPRPGDVARIAATGTRDFIDRQLQPETIADDEATWLTRRISSLNLDAPEVFDFTPEELLSDLRRGTVLRAAYGERQLLEVMVEFWSDHFNIFADKEDCARLKVIDDREVIRPHALGRFRDLVRASATSPAMLAYLDGRANVAGNPNENHARELLELHTLGIDGGYTQRDVREAARALTGWHDRKRFARGRAVFDPTRHDGGRKSVLGRTIAGGAERDLDDVIDLVARHPATARHLSRKLCRRFIGETASEALCQRVARRFLETDGDIRETLRLILHSDELATAPPKLKRPYRFALSVVRAIGARTDGGDDFVECLRRMGQSPFGWPTPDGYPEADAAWEATVLARWNFVWNLLAGSLRGTTVEDAAGSVIALAPSVLHRPLAMRDRELLAAADNPREALALVLCFPDFQYH